MLSSLCITDWKRELAPFYDQAKRMLGVTTTPFETRADGVMRELAERLGVADTYHPTPVGVFFGSTAELARSACHPGRHLYDTSRLDTRRGQRRLVGRDRPVPGGVGGAVRIARLELMRVEVPGADDDRAPVIEDVVQRRDGRLLPAVLSAGARKHAADLADERVLDPKPARLIEEIPHLGRHVPEPGRRSEDDRVVARELSRQLGERRDQTRRRLPFAACQAGDFGKQVAIRQAVESGTDVCHARVIAWQFLPSLEPACATKRDQGCLRDGFEEKIARKRLVRGCAVGYARVVDHSRRWAEMVSSTFARGNERC